MRVLCALAGRVKFQAVVAAPQIAICAHLAHVQRREAMRTAIIEHCDHPEGGSIYHQGLAQDSALFGLTDPQVLRPRCHVPSILEKAHCIVLCGSTLGIADVLTRLSPADWVLRRGNGTTCRRQFAY